MLSRVRADLHVHTCLSPCGDLQMSPQKIVAQAQQKNIGIIAICDHNSAQNAPAVMHAARASDVVVLPGMEVCSREEIHLLGIFQDLDAAFALQTVVYDHLPGKNNPDVFGLQVVANEADEVVEILEKLLIGATDLDVDRIVNEIHHLGGLAIASHVDRESFSVFSQIGFIPETLGFDALELTGRMMTDEARHRFASGGEAAFIRNSDAHRLEELGTNTSEYLLECPTLQEIRKALKKEDGRMVFER
jgi:3',5'-nucleoside bisphosphate phosphatase